MSWGDADQAFVNRDLFGGTGIVRVWDLLGSAALDPFTQVVGCELAPGASVGRHRQQDFPELVVVTDGTGVITVDEVPAEVVAGSLVRVPLGAVLALDNPSEAPLRYLIIKGRG